MDLTRKLTGSRANVGSCRNSGNEVVGGFCSGAPPWDEREWEKHKDGPDASMAVRNEGHDGHFRWVYSARRPVVEPCMSPRRPVYYCTPGVYVYYTLAVAFPRGRARARVRG